jgi:iron-sulfur cluster repair protein YtfE (RIC family)
MEGMRAGLRSRLRRLVQQVEEQHLALRQVAIELDRALAAGARESADAWLTRMRDGLAAHFDLEEAVLFPAIHGFDGSTRPEIEQLERDHGRFLEQLRAMLEYDPGASSPASAHLKGLRERLTEHEQREERLLERALAGSEE